MTLSWAPEKSEQDEAAVIATVKLPWTKKNIDNLKRNRYHCVSAEANASSEDHSATSSVDGPQAGTINGGFKQPPSMSDYVGKEVRIAPLNFGDCRLTHFLLLFSSLFFIFITRLKCL